MVAPHNTETLDQNCDEKVSKCQIFFQEKTGNTVVHNATVQAGHRAKRWTDFPTYLSQCNGPSSSSACVMAIFWARVLCRLVVEEARFRMRDTLGVILIRSLVYTKHVPGRLRSGSGVAWISGIMRKSSSRANAPSIRFSVLINSWDNFLVTRPSISLRNLSYVVFLWSGNIWVLCQFTPRTFLTIFFV